MSEVGCPVCGYPKFAETYPESGSTYDICPCCSFQSGVDGIGWDRDERNRTFRERWLAKGAPWWSEVRPPDEGWSAEEQLRNAGLLGEPADADEDEVDDEADDA